MNNRRVQVVNATTTHFSIESKKRRTVEQIVDIDNQIAQQQNIVAQSTNQYATDRAELESLDAISLRIKNEILFLRGERFLVIPFLFEQEMPIEIASLAILNRMNNDVLRYYSRGHGLSDQGNQPELRKRLVIFFRVSRDHAEIIYSD